MIKYLRILLIFISLNSFSQEFNFPLAEDSFLFTYKDQSYVISGDSIYSNPNGLQWVAKKHNLLIKDFVFINDKNKGYLMHNSGGIIYEFDGTNFYRLDDSFEFNSQYQSFPFVYKGAIYNFGGYGLFTFKNIITYFNETKKETELVQIKTPISQNPTGRKKMFAQLEDNRLYIGSGFGYNENSADGYKESVIFSDYWFFDLQTKEWKKLGEGDPLVNNDKYHLTYNFNNKTLVITNEKVFTIDLKNNTVTLYDNANIDILKSNKKDDIRHLITYNKAQDGFYLVLEKPNFKNKLVFIKTKDFMGNPTKSTSLYVENSNTTLYYFLVLLGVIALSVFILFRNKNTYKKINSKRKEINLILNEEEKQLFNLIFDKHPGYIPFPELMDVFESHLSYESRKKKLRSSLYQIEDKIMGVLKSKKKVFVERKNKEDLRIKEIKIQ